MGSFCTQYGRNSIYIPETLVIAALHRDIIDSKMLHFRDNNVFCAVLQFR